MSLNMKIFFLKAFLRDLLFKFKINLILDLEDDFDIFLHYFKEYT